MSDLRDYWIWIRAEELLAMLLLFSVSVNLMNLLGLVVAVWLV